MFIPGQLTAVWAIVQIQHSQQCSWSMSFYGPLSVGSVKSNSFFSAAVREVDGIVIYTRNDETINENEK